MRLFPNKSERGDLDIITKGHKVLMMNSSLNCFISRNKGVFS